MRDLFDFASMCVCVHIRNYYGGQNSKIVPNGLKILAPWHIGLI